MRARKNVIVATTGRSFNNRGLDDFGICQKTLETLQTFGTQFCGIAALNQTLVAMWFDILSGTIENRKKQFPESYHKGESILMRDYLFCCKNVWQS